MQENRFMEIMTKVSLKLGNQIHLLSIRDAFSILVPFYVLGGLVVLISAVIAPYVFSGSVLEAIQLWSTLVNNAALGILGLLIAALVAYTLSRHKRYNNPIMAAAVSIGALITMFPVILSTTPLDAKTQVLVKNMIDFKYLGAQYMFAGLFCGLFATELFLKLNKIKFLKINVGKDVPPQLIKSFESMIPTIITLIIAGSVSAFFITVIKMDFVNVVSTVIQAPLRHIGTSLPGYLILYGFGLMLFSCGIHHVVIFGAILEPLLLANISENMMHFSHGEAVEHIFTKPFATVFSGMGGAGGTIALLIAILVFSKYTPSRTVAKLALVPAIFSINEPLLFGMPVVLNPPLMIPFILVPLLNAIVGYFFTVFGLVSKTVIFIPWMTPPLLSGWISTGGDWRMVVLQFCLIVINVFMYLPFLKISDKVAIKLNQKDQ